VISTNNPPTDKTRGRCEPGSWRRHCTAGPRTLPAFLREKDLATTFRRSRVTRFVSAIVLGAFLLSPSLGTAQTIGGQLSTLLTEQRPGTPVFVPDPVAAAATFNTVAGLFAIELSTLPTAASSGGFVYRLNPSLGIVERASDGFGPFFTERLLRNSRGQSSVGLNYQFASFGSLQGANLRSGSFPTNAARSAGSAQPFSIDTLALELEAQTTTLFATYGITDRLAVGGTMPFMNVRFSGTRVRTTNGVSTLQSSQSGSATGIGDVNVQARYALVGDSVRGFSVGGDLKLATGKEENLLGAGDTAARAIGIGSWEEGQLAVYGNAGFGVGGASKEVFWNGAATIALTPRITVVGEVMGRWLADLSLVQDVYEPHPQVVGIETMRWLPAERGIHTTFLATGAKWNFGGSWLLSTNLLFRVTDAGLRARVTPAVSIDYAFDR
jgi:hypothetical protein